MKTKIIVIYHRADFDGIFCREIAKKFLGNEAEYIGWDYGDARPIIFGDAEKIYMLDITIDEIMGDSRIIWIDHHKSSMVKFDSEHGGMYDIKGYRIDGVAACRLTWQWFSKRETFVHPTGGSFAVPLAYKQDFIDRLVIEPLAVRLAGEYDIWDKRDPRAQLFQHGLRSRDLEGLWEQLLGERWHPPIKEIEAMIDAGHPFNLGADGMCDPSESVVENLLNSGRSIQYFKDNENEGIIKSYGFDVEFEGLKFLACNHARFNSHLFTAAIRPEHAALLGFNWDGKQWRVSLYGIDNRPEIDLSLIAVKYGGGGHKGACGFRVNSLPFSK